ncbi:hypothetical protein HK103_003533 [Boothiomyces macroporosus]|uniref:Uncharacterized protein n=1 Tax=Boothiomyces macroporosus TaxID=261099 RepID=A0AAD5UHT7_9FUNG|nr:hypothetical protein HK103_003533 [Boothiomyces macroporosus]
MQNLKSIQSAVLDENNVQKYLEVFTDTEHDYNRIFRNQLLQKFKKFYKQDITMWDAIRPHWIRAINRPRDLQYYQQFNVLLLIFLDSSFGLQIISDTRHTVTTILQEEMDRFEDLDLFLFLKPLVALITKTNIQIDSEKYLEFGLKSLDSSLESRLLASVLVGTILSKYTTTPISVSIKAISNADFESSNNKELEMLRRHSANVEKQILLIGGILQSNPHSLLELPVESFLSLYSTLNTLIVTHSESKVQTFGFQALSRWYQVAILKKFEPSQEIIIQSLLLILEKWDDSAVSQQKLREIFASMIDLVLSGNELLRFITEKLSKIYQKKVKYDLLTILATKVPSELLFELDPNLLKSTFQYLDRPSLNQSAAAFIVHVLKKLVQDRQDIKKFSSLMIDSLVGKNAVIRKYTAERILPVYAKLDFEGLEMVATGIEPDNEVSLEAIVSCMKVAKGLGKTLELKSGKYGDITQNSIISAIPRLRYQAFCHITESSKANQDVTEREIFVVMQFWKLDGCGETVDFRQQISSTFSKFFERLKRSIYKNERDILTLEKKLSNKPELSSEIQPILDATIRQRNLKTEFFTWIFNDALNNLYPGSSFPRTVGSIIILDLLDQTDKLVVDVSASLKIQLFEFNSSKIFQIIFSRIVFDTFGDSRRDLLTYLKNNDLPKMEYGTPSFCQYLMSKVYQLFASKRAADSDSAAYICRIIYIEYVSKQNLSLRDVTVISPKVDFVDLLIEKLQNHVDFAQKDLVGASVTHPLNSILASIHNVLQEVKFDNCAEWEKTLKNLTELCFQVCKICQKVCSDASPEGNLPAEVETDPESKVAQILLRHCFRSIKQATDCISFIAGVLLKLRHPSGYEYVKRAGELFSELLTTVRHRGAFNSVQENLSIVCKIVSSKRDFYHLLQQWLDNFINQISSLEVSVTRRSAGLPAAILAIISAPSNDHKAAFLHYTIEKLIAIAQNPVDSKKIVQIDLPQVHAMNVLRILVSDSELTTITRDYIGTCFEICILQFKSDYFPIRNCAAMLFSSLVNKAFGTKKTKSEGEFVNLVFAREFFGRYPSLYQVMLDELKNAVKLLKQNQVCPLLYPLLGILSRSNLIINLAKPIPLASEDSLYSSKVFEVLVKECAHAVQWKVREISARTLATLIDSSRCLVVVQEITSQLKLDSSANFTHGVALQVSEILEIHWGEYSQSNTSATLDLARLFTSIEWLLKDNKFAVARGVFLKSLYNVFYRGDDSPEVNSVRQLGLNVSKRMLDGTLSLKYCPQYHLQTACAIVCHKSNFDSSISFVESILTFQNQNIAWMLFEAIPSNCRNAAIRNIAVTYFTDHSSTQILVAESAKIISLLENKVQVIDSIKFWFNRQITFDLVKALLHLLSQIIIDARNMEHARYLIAKCTKYLKEDQPVDLRLAAARSLNEIRHVKLGELELEYCLLIREILEDDDENVRQSVSECVAILLNMKFAITETLASTLLLDYLEKFYPVEYHLSILCTNDYQNLGSMNMDLFDQEEMNSYKQPFKNILLSMHYLETTLDRVHIDKLNNHIHVVWDAISKIEDLEWTSNYELVFNVLAQCIAIAKCGMVQQN